MAKMSIPVGIELQLHAFANRVLLSFHAAGRVTHREIHLRTMSRKRFIKKMMGQEGVSRDAATGLADALSDVFGSYACVSEKYHFVPSGSSASDLSGQSD